VPASIDPSVPTNLKPGSHLAGKKQYGGSSGTNHSVTLTSRLGLSPEVVRHDEYRVWSPGAPMRVLVAIGVWLLIGTTPVLAWGQSPNSPGSSNQAPYTLQVNSRVVLTDVLVTDKQGNPVTGLTENDFRFLDNGKPQQIASFEEHRQQAPQLTEVSATPGRFSNDYLRHPPAQVNALLFDTTTIGIADQMYLFQQMKKFVKNLPPGEPVAIFTRAGSVTIELASFTDDHATLLAAIGKAIPRLQRPGAWMASDLDTLQQIAVYLDRIPGRKNLLWFTSGSNMFLGSDPASAILDPNERRAIYDLLESERIAIYPIDPRGLTVESSSAAISQQMQMRQDAAATGGAAYVHTNGLALAAQHILTTDGNYYTLSYTPNHLKSNSDWHRVEVKLVNAGYDLSYRHGYFDDGSNRPPLNRVQPGRATNTRTVLREGGNKVEVQMALDDRSEPLIFSIRIARASPTAAPLPEDSPLKKGETHYVVKYYVPAKDVYAAYVHGNVGTDELGTSVSVYDRNGELVSRKALNFALSVDQQQARSLPDAKLIFVQNVNLPQGSNYLYLGVWDMTTGRTGTVNASVDVKKPTG
jgi:VWFA-related protein